jgi:hypothetical protein
MSAVQAERRFYTGIAIAALAVVLVGFGRSYSARLSAGPPMSALVQLHAVLFVGWMLFFVSQTSLVAARRTATHKQFGWAGAALAGAMIVVGWITAIAAARRGHGPENLGGPLGFLTISLGDLLIFAACIAAAVALRGQPVAHKRLMLLGTVAGLLPAAIGRLPLIGSRMPLVVLVFVLFLAAGPIFDRFTRGRIHPIGLWGGLLAFASVPARLALGQTEAWNAAASWLVG